MPVRKQIKVNKEQHLKIIIVLIIIVVVLGRVFMCRGADVSIRVSESELASINVPRFSRLEIPAIDDSTFVIINSQANYTLLYDTLYRQGVWVAYILTKDQVEHKASKRSNRFVPDPQIVEHRWPTAHNADYTKSGYDRGHLLPSADRDDDQNENDATFLLSNVSPQSATLNRGEWMRLEQKVRDWAVKYDSIYIVTAGVLTDGLERIKGGVGVPKNFYKALLINVDGTYYAVGFLLPNHTKLIGNFYEYMVSIDSLETVTKINFFPSLPDSIERRVESNISKRLWR